MKIAMTVLFVPGGRGAPRFPVKHASAITVLVVRLKARRLTTNAQLARTGAKTLHTLSSWLTPATGELEYLGMSVLWALN